VLDIAFFSSIIYIWYEGYLLRPPVVRWSGGARVSESVSLRSLGGQMAKKAKKAAKKAAKKTAKKK
jgi:hypothetical protein